VAPIVADVAAVTATVFTDPFCPWSWAVEPHLRRLESEFGQAVAITFVMAGLRRQIHDGPALALSALDAAARSGMPLDPRVFLKDPPASTHPAGLAVHAVAEQDGGAHVGPYLRRLREAILLEGRRMDSAPALLDAARELDPTHPGLDLDRLRAAFGSSAIVEALGADLERAAAVAPEHHEPGTGRVKLPSIEFRGPDGAVHGAYGYVPWVQWRAAAVAAGAEPAATAAPPTVEEALRRFGPLTTPEVAAVCGFPPPPAPQAPAALWQAAQEWRVRPRPVLGGELWEAA
jgi:predicted DsbA family dithiol-disulfide isomerase